VGTNSVGIQISIPLSRYGYASAGEQRHQPTDMARREAVGSVGPSESNHARAQQSTHARCECSTRNRGREALLLLLCVATRVLFRSSRDAQPCSEGLDWSIVPLLVWLVPPDREQGETNDTHPPRLAACALQRTTAKVLTARCRRGGRERICQPRAPGRRPRATMGPTGHAREEEWGGGREDVGDICWLLNEGYEKLQGLDENKPALMTETAGHWRIGP
jgi:hypothetical protein